MIEVNKLYHFLTSLKPWAKKEFQIRGVKNVNAAIMAAESLKDYSQSGNKREVNCSIERDTHIIKWQRSSSRNTN